MSHPLDVESLRGRVQLVLDEFLDAQAQRLRELGPDIEPLLDVISGLLAGGKRLRPAFCYWGWRAAGGADSSEIITAATAFEMFHTAALLHDDVMDDSNSRRGRMTAHRHIAAHHRRLGWRGDSERFGMASAILAGDLCLSWSDDLFNGCQLPGPALTAARPTFELMRTQLMGGQYLDLLEQVLPTTQGGGEIDRIRRVIQFKSARYSIEHPLVIGAALAGGSTPLLTSFSTYASPLGEAFQLRDDILGVFGNPDQTGKPAGDDLREGKRTLLIAFALENACDTQVKLLNHELGNPQLNKSGVAKLHQVIVETGALKRVEARIEELAEEATMALRADLVPPPAFGVLRDLINTVTIRVS
ncbi:MAG: polyprenyl synthetase family protein [Actinomycetota bacterium]